MCTVGSYWAAYYKKKPTTSWVTFWTSIFHFSFHKMHNIGNFCQWNICVIPIQTFTSLDIVSEIKGCNSDYKHNQLLYNNNCQCLSGTSWSSKAIWSESQIRKINLCYDAPVWPAAPVNSYLLKINDWLPMAPTQPHNAERSPQGSPKPDHDEHSTTYKP